MSWPERTQIPRLSKLRYGFCRRYPSRITAFDRRMHLDRGLWPVTMDIDWCGEWQRRGGTSKEDDQ